MNFKKLYKKSIIATILTCTLLPCHASEVTTPTFHDVLEEDWFTPYVYYATEQGIIAGFEDNFYPMGNCSRAIIAQALAVLGGADLDAQPPSQMYDVANTPYESAVVWCIQEGIMAGMDDSYFGAEEPLTREQFAVALLGFTRYEQVYFTPIEARFVFADQGNVSEWAKPAMVWAVENALIFGDGALVSPQGYVTRAELATMLYRYSMSEKETSVNLERLAEFAETFLQFDYKEGGTDTTGFDCAGLAHYIYLSCGITIPSTVRNIYTQGEQVEQENLQLGDLLFFGTISHVAIYIGNQTFVHASTPTIGIVLGNYTSEYYAQNYVSARRIIGYT